MRNVWARCGARRGISRARTSTMSRRLTWVFTFSYVRHSVLSDTIKKTKMQGHNSGPIHGDHPGNNFSIYRSHDSFSFSQKHFLRPVSILKSMYSKFYKYQLLSLGLPAKFSSSILIWLISDGSSKYLAPVGHFLIQA